MSGGEGSGGGGEAKDAGGYAGNGVIADVVVLESSAASALDEDTRGLAVEDAVVCYCRVRAVGDYNPVEVVPAPLRRCA